MTAVIVLLLVGLVALMIGGELLVRGAVGLAEKAGVTPLVIGLVIVGFGTSMPELVTSIEAVLAGSPAIAWGNIAGSNMANSLLILGFAAMITPIILKGESVLRDPTIALAASFGLLALSASGLAHWSFGLIMLACLAGYIGWCYWQEKASASPADIHNAPHDRAAALELTDAGLHRLYNGWAEPALNTLLGLAVLVGGGHLLVTSAIDLARLAGLSETLIGLTIVAVGTSLPELVTSGIAAWRRQPEVAFGNVIGSNIYNVLGIGGVTMMFAPGSLSASLLSVDLVLVTASAVLILGICAIRRRFGRSVGAALIAGYATYLAFLIINI